GFWAEALCAAVPESATVWFDPACAGFDLILFGYSGGDRSGNDGPVDGQGAAGNDIFPRCLLPASGTAVGCSRNYLAVDVCRYRVGQSISAADRVGLDYPFLARRLLF